jgi:hypothetical protein
MVVTMLLRRTWWVAAVLVLASGCAATPDQADGPDAPGGPGDPPPASVDVGPVAADTVAIRVDYLGGYLPALEIAARSPVVSVYGDGRVITEGSVPAIYPGLALRTPQQRRIAAAEVTAFVRKAFAAGVGSTTDFGRPTVTDMPDTRFTVTTAEGTRQVTVYALDLDDDAALRSLTDAQRAARRKLKAVLDELRAGGGAQAYPVSSLAAVSLAYEEPSGIPSPPAPVAWPGPALPGDPLRSGGTIGCVTVTGDAAKAVLAAAAGANLATPWTSGGRTWIVRLRPLLPDEKGCADLEG